MAPISKECELLVIGDGNGGLACARASGQHGVKTIAVESNRLGRTCVNVGYDSDVLCIGGRQGLIRRRCVPKKITWNAAAIVETLHEATAYGFHIKETALFDPQAEA